MESVAKSKPLSQCTTFEEISLRRQETFRRNEEDGDHYEDILAHIYEKPTHFVYELLQNADDARATKVCFELNDNQLVFSHDGSKNFDLKDIIGITGVGNSTKKDNEYTVGKFGVGFKSVFSITKRPLVYNLSYNFCIENLIVPRKIDPIPLDQWTTKFVLPFESDRYSTEEIYERIKSEFAELSCMTIMFLKKIRSLEIIAGDERRTISTRSKNTEHYSIITDGTEQAQYYKFTSPAKASLVYKFKEGKFTPINGNYIYSYLPTRVRSGLPFQIDAPFELATTRESIEFQREHNAILLGDIISLFQFSLETFRNEGMLNADFLEDILPMDTERCADSEIYARINAELPNILQSTPLLPTRDGKYVCPQDGVLYERAAIAKLSKYKQPWLAIGDSSLKTYLKNILNVEEINSLDLSYYFVQNNILNTSTSKNWLIRYYTLIANDKLFNSWVDYSAQGALRTLPIVLTRTGRFEAAYVDGTENIFRYVGWLSPSKIVNTCVTNQKDEETRGNLAAFLRIMGISEPSIRDYIESRLMPGWGNKTDEERLQVFYEICKYYNGCTNDSDHAEIAEYMNDNALFPAVQNGTRKWLSGHFLMRGTKSQKTIFKNQPFLDERAWINQIETDKKGVEHQIGTADLCRAAGVCDSLPIIRRDDWNSIESSDIKKYHLERSGWYVWSYNERRDITGWTDAIKNISTAAHSHALVKLLSSIDKDNAIEEITMHNPRGYASQGHSDIPARHLRQLNNYAWIYNGDEKMYPRQILQEDFINLYQLNGSEPFLEALDFKPSELSALPDEDREILEDIRSLSPDEREVLDEWIKQKKEKRNQERNSIQSESIEAIAELPDQLEEEEFSDQILTREDILGEDRSGVNVHDTATVATTMPTQVTKKSPSPSSINLAKKKFGDQAEEMITNILKEQFPDHDIIWNGNNNKGYDIEVAKDGATQRLIEVKATKHSTKRINITPSEWNRANIEGDKYTIYIINAETGKYTILNNPYQMYLDKRLNIEVNAIILP